MHILIEAHEAVQLLARHRDLPAIALNAQAIVGDSPVEGAQPDAGDPAGFQPGQDNFVSGW
jgi:hypothetical protein